MCLIQDKNYPRKKSGSIRYKVLTKTRTANDDTVYVSPYYGKRYQIGGTYKKNTKVYDINKKGFHVFRTLKSARHCKGIARVILKCECKGFIAGGLWSIHESEIWREITIIGEVK